ncbi:BTB/POZ domain-containing protein 7-like [Dendronephthya gigantea]|uniref:BTB/POZ domain-containing protein 7-like n=1 Tax=Dendronephthya gigantea TaxID=151771 RepID=UPI00106D4351|nr:BTB/POZ domain-containing protein 7-like [Dendronephthya gigantea]
MGGINSLHNSRSVENIPRRQNKARLEGKKNVSKFATLRKKFSRHKSSHKTQNYVKHIRELTQSWNTHQINALVEEYESLSALKDLSIQTSLARPRVRTLKEDLLAMYEQQYFTDVVLQFRGCEFHCHRFLLSLRSPFFHTILEKNPGHNAKIQIDIANPELTVDIFRMMLHYLYTGDVPTFDTALVDNLEILMKMGDEFGTPNVLELDMNVLLNTSKFSDVILVFKDNFAGIPQTREISGVESSFELHCHKAILAARSPFFHTLLTTLAKEGDFSKPLKLVLDEKIIPRQYGRVLLQCMYLDCVDVSSVIRWALGSDERSIEDPHKLLTVPEVAMEVYEIARFLDFATLEQGAEDIIIQELSPMSLLASLEWSNKPHGSHWVYRQTMHYLREEFLNLVHLDVFLNLPKQFLIEALKSDFLQASEQDVLLAVMKWGEAQVYKTMYPSDGKLEHYTSSLKRSIRRKDIDVKSLKHVLHGVLQLIRVQHILPKDSSVLKVAIQQGLLQKKMPLDIGEGERQQRSSWIRVNDDRKYVKPRLFSAYVDEAKAIMRERMVEEMEVVRLRMIRRSDMPDMVTSITSQYCTPEYEDGPPSVIANELPYPDQNTVKAMLNREKELKSFNQTQRAYALSLGDGRAVNHEVRKRVVREFGLPDVAVEVLRHARKNTAEDFPGSQESLLLSYCSNEKLSIPSDTEPDVTLDVQAKKKQK